ncbi:MAG: VWA domain-containing protein [Caldilineaceae bacterium]|nr:VWA domain-containing protein [Caldilineaceae bacterium]
MSFIWPAMLFSLLVVPLFVWLYWQMQQRRRAMAVRYGSLGMVQTAGRPLGAGRHLAPMLFLTGLILLLIALARPQAVVSLPRLEGTVILAFDVSGSMAADDLAPTRMEASKTAALAFVERQPATIQLGVVAFSDSGFSIVPPTYDRDPIFAAINRLVPERGTSLAHGIFTSLNTILIDPADAEQFYSNLTPTPTPTPPPVPPGSNAAAVIVLLTDGENTAPPEPSEAAQAAADLGIRIYPIGIGSAAGTTLDVEGFTVHTRLDEATLEQIAQLTAGTYYNAANEEELQRIYENLTPELVIKSDEMEVTALFAGVSILLLLSGGLVSLLWFSRLP